MRRHDRQRNSCWNAVVVDWQLYWLRTLLDPLRLSHEL